MGALELAAVSGGEFSADATVGGGASDSAAGAAAAPAPA